MTACPPRFAASLLAAALAGGLAAAPAGAAEWSRSVTVYPEVLAALSAEAPVRPLPARRGPQLGASVEYRWELLAELTPPDGSFGGGGGAPLARGFAGDPAYGKAPPALIRPGEAAQWVTGTGAR